MAKKSMVARMSDINEGLTLTEIAWLHAHKTAHTVGDFFAIACRPVVMSTPRAHAMGACTAPEPGPIPETIDLLAILAEPICQAPSMTC